MAKGGNKKLIKGTDYIGIGVGAAIIKDGKLLIQKRSQNVKNERGKWEIPGGSIEWGETQDQALKREIKEELGVEIELLELITVFDHILPNEKQHWVAPTYICKIIKGTPENMEPEKCSEFGWFTLTEAKKLDLAGITAHDISLLKKRFPKGLPKNL